MHEPEDASREGVGVEARSWSEEDIEIALAKLRETGQIDAGGIAIDAPLLERMLQAAPKTEDGDHPHFKAANFGEVAFEDNVDFRGVTFGMGVNFSKTTFGDKARFGGVTYQDRARFGGGATFGPVVALRDLVGAL